MNFKLYDTSLPIAKINNSNNNNELPNDSILGRYADELTSNEYITNPAVARDNEIRNTLLILIYLQGFFNFTCCTRIFVL